MDAHEKSAHRRKQVFIAIGAAAFLALGVWVYFTFIESDEAKIRRLLARMIDAAERRNPREVVEPLDADFKISYRRYGVEKEEVRKALIHLFMVQFKHGFQARLEPEEVPVEVAEDGLSATARFRLFARGRASQGGDWMELSRRETSGKIEFQAAFRNTPEGWRMSSLTFTRGE